MDYSRGHFRVTRGCSQGHSGDTLGLPGSEIQQFGLRVREGGPSGLIGLGPGSEPKIAFQLTIS